VHVKLFKSPILEKWRRPWRGNVSGVLKVSVEIFFQANWSLPVLRADLPFYILAAMQHMTLRHDLE
jgi:hypothetical protein